MGRARACLAPLALAVWQHSQLLTCAPPAAARRAGVVVLWHDDEVRACGRAGQPCWGAAGGSKHLQPGSKHLGLRHRRTR